MTKNRILVVDDNKNVLEGLNLLLGEKYDTFLAFDGESALEIIRSKDIDLVITDMVMPGISGLELLGKIKSLKPDITVVILTGHGTIELAVEAMKKGAAGLIEKPFQVDKILIDVENLLKIRRLERKNRVFQRKLTLEERKLQFVAENENMKKIMKRVKALRKNDANVLIAGEPGVGKELLARIIHKYSTRREYPFVKVNCGLITVDTFYEILCGKPGEEFEKPGMFAMAEGGSIFFDHIEKMDLQSQSMLAEILRDGQYPLPSGNAYTRLNTRI
ncbi:MAG: sigma-54-dependent Fis family transcriptional regulator, partial [Acidobacteria bacterium]|nr:sigma-54-dependent Fis family transcriptional regulator [Acidobacteriota bacterium]